MPPKRNAARVPKQTYKEDIEDDTIEEVDDDPEPALPSAKRAKADASNARRLDDINDPPPSSGLGQETQQFTAALQAFQKQQAAPKDTFLAKFVKEAEKKRVEIAELPKKRDRELAEQNSTFIKAFNAQINAALTMPTTKPKDKDKTKSQTKTQQLQTVQDLFEDNHPLFAASNAWLNVAKHTLETYKSACKLVTDARPAASLGENWTEESDALIGILDMGKRVTERQIDAMMERKENTASRAEEEDEAETARALLGIKLIQHRNEVGNGQQQSVSWVESVRCAERGVKRMVGGLPMTPVVVD